MEQLRGVPALPPMRAYRSPEVVRAFDRLRAELERRGGSPEFCWFAREYPRCYRFHMDGADFRLRSIHRLMTAIHLELADKVSSYTEGRVLEVAVSDERVKQIYWDFDSYLSEVSVSLDLLARIVGPAFSQETPPSFGRLCKWGNSHVLIRVFRKAEKLWVRRLKDYRDCFVHYTPVDTQLGVSLIRYGASWELRAKLPTNPNIREILGFRYSRRVELLHYAVAVHKHLVAFDKIVATAVLRLHREGSFPFRKERLFFKGSRSRAAKKGADHEAAA